MRLRVTLLAAVLTTAAAVPALAFQCPADLKKVEAVMAGAMLDHEQRAEVHRLHAEGQRLHSEGKHREAMAALTKAMQILGVL
jgi:hypothetical protein